MLLNVLIVSDRKILNHHIKDILQKESVSSIDFCEKTDQIKALYKEKTYDIVIINDHCITTYHDLIFCQKQFDAMILLMKTQNEEIDENIDQIITFIKPIKKQTLAQVLHVCIQTKLQIKAVNQRLQELTQRYEEMKILDQAKFLLIEQAQLSESQAHRLIEKQAMNARCHKRVIAKKYIDQYKGKGE